MPLRTNPTKVKDVLVAGKNYSAAAEGSLTPCIEAANALTDEVYSCAVSKGVSLSTTLLEKIETYLACHFYGHSDQFLQARSTEGASGTFQGKTDLGLNGSQYGQTAMTLDISGCLRAFNAGGRVQLLWLGTEYD